MPENNGPAATRPRRGHRQSGHFKPASKWQSKGNTPKEKPSPEDAHHQLHDFYQDAKRRSDEVTMWHRVQDLFSGLDHQRDVESAPNGGWLNSEETSQHVDLWELHPPTPPPGSYQPQNHLTIATTAARVPEPRTPSWTLQVGDTLLSVGDDALGPLVPSCPLPFLQPTASAAVPPPALCFWGTMADVPRPSSGQLPPEGLLINPLGRFGIDQAGIVRRQQEPTHSQSPPLTRIRRHLWQAPDKRCSLQGLVDIFKAEDPDFSALSANSSVHRDVLQLVRRHPSMLRYHPPSDTVGLYPPECL